MSREEFIKYIRSIGFKYSGKGHKADIYYYKEYKLLTIDYYYKFKNVSTGMGWYTMDHLVPFETYFKKELRTIKLKALLG